MYAHAKEHLRSLERLSTRMQRLGSTDPEGFPTDSETRTQLD